MCVCVVYMCCDECVVFFFEKIKKRGRFISRGEECNRCSTDQLATLFFSLSELTNCCKSDIIVEVIAMVISRVFALALFSFFFSARGEPSTNAGRTIAQLLNCSILFSHSILCDHLCREFDWRIGRC